MNASDTRWSSPDCSRARSARRRNKLQGSKQRNGLNVNAIVSQDEADMGRGPVFYSTLAEIEKVVE